MPRCPVCGAVLTSSGYKYHVERYINTLIGLGVIQEDSMWMNGHVVYMYKYKNRWYMGPTVVLEAVVHDRPDLRDYLIERVDKKKPVSLG